jgi:tetratricopeptide (TPR) repeat protein
LIAGVSFGQKKVLSDAKNEMKASNIANARTLIKEAMNNPETANDPETWFTAGSIENKQFDMENIKSIKKEPADTITMYKALDAILPYFEKSYELDNLPDEKGKVKTKYSKDIRSITKANRNSYLDAGSYFFDHKEYDKAYRNFQVFTDMPELPMMKGEKFEVVGDDEFMTQIKFYAGIAASQVPDHQGAIKVLNSIKNSNYRESDVYRQLASEYDQIKDSVSLLNILKEGVTKFPGDEYFLMNMIDQSIKANNLSEAISYIQLAIEQNPKDVVLYDALGVIYENSDNSAKALENYEKALSIDPNYAKALKHTGMYYYNAGVKLRGEADAAIKDQKVYDKKYAEALESYRKALPYLEKAFEADPTDRDTIFCLRGSYYSLNMGAKFEKMDKLFSGE